MADPRLDRGAYLDRVAADLRLPPDSTTDVVDELRAHLDAAVADLEAEGLDPALAEREAIARLGDPTSLATGIRTARQTRRRLLIAAGYGVIAGFRGVIWGYLFAFAVVMLGVVLSAVLIQVLVSVQDMEGYSWSDVSGLLTVPYTVFATGYAGYLVPPAVARRSDRRVADVRGAIALIGGLAVGVIAVFVIRLDMTSMLALALVSMPFAFAGGALLARDDGAVRSARIRLDWRSMVIVGAASALVISLIALTTLRPSLTYGPGTGGEMPTTGPWQYPQAAEEVMWSSSSGTTATTSYVMAVAFDDGMPVEWRDLRVEVWPSDERGIPSPGVEAPLFVVPMTEIADIPGAYEAFIDLEPATTPTHYSLASTVVEGSGQRTLLGGPDVAQAPAWNGSLWEYATERWRNGGRFRRGCARPSDPRSGRRGPSRGVDRRTIRRSGLCLAPSGRRAA